MKKVTGKGFLIRKLKNVLPVKRIVDALKQADCSWVCIKVANGTSEYNNSGEVNGDKELKQIIQELKDAGLEIIDLSQSELDKIRSAGEVVYDMVREEVGNEIVDILVDALK